MKKEGIKPIKSINTELDDYVKDINGKYYHSECYLLHLMSKKKLSEEKALQQLKERKYELKEEMQEMKDKDDFFNWIKDFYKTSLSSYYCSEIAKLTNGTHQKIYDSISYSTLLDIYQKMSNYLLKKASSLTFKSVNQRMNYDLAVVIGNYGDYKKYKERQTQIVENKNQVDRKIEDSKRYENSLKEREIKESDNFDLVDIMDELIL